MLSTILNGRGMLAHRQGDLPQAAAHVERHLAIDRARLGADHPRVALGTANFAFVRERLGDLDAADSLYAAALGVFSAALDDAHPLRYAVATSLANVRAKRGLHDEAGSMFEQALAGTRRVTGATPELAVGLSQYADLLSARGMLDSAERVAMEAMRIERGTFGPAHPAAATTLVQVAGIQCARGAHAEAIAAYRDGISVLESRLPAEHPRIGDAKLKFGRCLTQAARHADAEQQLLAVFESAGGGSAAPLAARAVPAARALADLYDAWGREADAARYRALADAPADPAPTP
jgi:tetratricopeptide (TPR) repeat protein